MTYRDLEELSLVELCNRLDTYFYAIRAEAELRIKDILRIKKDKTKTINTPVYIEFFNRSSGIYVNKIYIERNEVIVSGKTFSGKDANEFFSHICCRPYQLRDLCENFGIY